MQTSFGFGQVGGSALILHPRYLFGAIKPSAYKKYHELNRERSLQSYKAMSEMMTLNSLVKIKEHPPFSAELEGAVLLNPLARVSKDKEGELSYSVKQPSNVKSDAANLDIVNKLMASESGTVGVGVDQGSCI